MVVNNYRPALKEYPKRKRKFTLLWGIILLLLFCLSIALTFIYHEVKTSRLQAKEISEYASSLSYTLEKGPNDSVVYPGNGPFDKRLGYSQLPQLLSRVQSKGMHITYQAKFSPALMNYASKGFFTPYSEKSQTGLKISDSKGKTMYRYNYPTTIYPSIDSVSPLIVNSLLFIEDRDLLNTETPYLNPAINWTRFTKASLHRLGSTIGLNYKTIGGSTLATQIEKFRHSPGGITVNTNEKLKQMVSASVRAYQNGPETLNARKDLALAYVNSVPLSGAPGYGEVHGLGDGLHVWFNSDMRQVNDLLNLSGVKGDTLQAQGQALRQVLSLMIAQRRPTFYLGHSGREELNQLTGSYLRLLAANNLISQELRDAGLNQKVNFRDFEVNPAVAPKSNDKGALIARTHLSGLLGKTLYDLDRMDLEATTTLQNNLQDQVTDYLNKLNNPVFASDMGVLGKRMLTQKGVESVLYSFTLFERTPNGNVVRVQTDNTDQPFDLNEGSKLELGSTAKMRVLVTYLEIIAEIHKRYADLTPKELRLTLKQPQDNLSQWVLQYLLHSKDKTLNVTLEAAMERRYSANPHEAFFTGGGRHYFHNFQNKDNSRRTTVREAFQKSINLPFVRIMRDIVKYTIHQQVGNPNSLIADVADPRRRVYLERFADREGKTYLWKFWRKYSDKTPDERFEKLLDGLYKDEVRLAVVHRFLYPETTYQDFDTFLRGRLPNEKIKDDRVLELYERYGPEAYNLSDQGYISKAHPLELWLLSFMLKQPDAKWSDVVAASEKQRQEVYAWLFRTRFKNARDSRIRTILELDAYEDIQKRWAKVGYPFGQLVPSLATALGSSGDRPEALAELMGIIMNNGIRQRTVRIEELHFAKLTPYETALKWKPISREQVMEPEVAAILREALTQVVDIGTARRIQGGLTKPDGSFILVGGKTGTGDNRYVTLTSRGYRVSSRAVNRTATFVFFLGDNHFGTLTAFVPGREAADYKFTSSLPVQVLRGMASILEPYLESKMKIDTPVPKTPNGNGTKLTLGGDDDIKIEQVNTIQHSLN